MKHWQETSHIVDRIRRVGRQGRSAALAVVTRVEGSAYRRTGAKLLIEAEGSTLGGISGGCLEEDVRQVGLEVIRTGRSRVLRYDTSDDEARVWGLGLGCDGRVEVLVLPISKEAASGPWARVRHLLQGDSPFAISLIVEEDGRGEVVAVGPSGRAAGGLDEKAADSAVEAAASAALRDRATRLEPFGSRLVFTEVLLPPPRLLVCGAGDDARPLVSFAAAAGLRVFVADHRAAHLAARRFPEAWELLPLRPEELSQEVLLDRDACAVVKTHSLKQDTEWVRRLAGTDVFYIGILGPRKRTMKILADLGIEGDERIFGPVGLDLGADGPEQVALSIVAELLAVRARREPHHLRLRESAVHAAR